MKIEVIGSHPPASGAGVIQERLIDELAKSDKLLPRGPVHQSIAARILHRSDSRADVSIFLQSPMPLRTGRNVNVAVVYDLRYLRTRTGAYSAYRLSDLKRTLRIADHVATISGAVKTQLELFVDATLLSVLPLGPGQFDGIDVGANERRAGSVLLMGAAEHKRNDLAVDCVEQALWEGLDLDVWTVGLSNDLEVRLARKLAPERVHLLRNLSPETLRATMQQCEVFLHCGVSEGFGFPYLETLSSGCVPICRDYSVSREIFGGSGVYLDDRDLTASFCGILAEADIQARWNSLASVLDRFQWGKMVEHFESVAK